MTLKSLDSVSLTHGLDCGLVILNCMLFPLQLSSYPGISPQALCSVKIITKCHMLFVFILFCEPDSSL